MEAYFVPEIMTAHSMTSEECPTCGTSTGPATSHGPDDYCSDACALRASQRVFDTLEEEIARLAPHISRDAFLEAMEHLAEDLSLRSGRQYRPLAKTGERSPEAKTAQSS